MTDSRLSVLVLGSPVLAGQLTGSRRLSDVDIVTAGTLDEAMPRIDEGKLDALVVHSPMLKPEDIDALTNAMAEDRAVLVVDHSANGEGTGRPTRVRRPDVEDALVNALRAQRGAAEPPKAPPSDSYAAGMAKLKQKFKDALPGRMGLVDETLAAAEADGTDENLDAAITAAHKLAGAAGMFEMKAVAAAALSIEKTIQGTRADGTDFATAKEQAEALRTEIDAVLAQD